MIQNILEGITKYSAEFVKSKSTNIKLAIESATEANADSTAMEGSCGFY